MNGQLYQECEKFSCGTEPVCAGCMFCEAHCECLSASEVEEIQNRQKARSEINKGYRLLENYIKEFGKSCQFPAGKAITDTRHYHIGAGYGAGSVFAVDMAGAVYLTIHTGSNVPEWASHSYILPEVEDTVEGDSYTNVQFVSALADLSRERPLCRSHQQAFSIMF